MEEKLDTKPKYVTIKPGGIISFKEPEPPRVVDLKELEDSLRDESGRVVPQMIKQDMTPLHEKRQKICHIMYDTKLDEPEKIIEETKAMDLDTFSRVTSRLDSTREVKLDHNITAMGILGLLTGSDD